MLDQASLVALCGYIWLEPKMKSLCDEIMLPYNRRLELMRKPVAFVVVWLIIGVAQSIAALLMGSVTTTILVGSLQVQWVIVPLLCASTPILGAVLFTLEYEVALARDEIDGLLRQAREKTLDRENYIAVRHRIKMRSNVWKVQLGLLTFISLYNTVALLLILNYPKMDPYITNRLSEDIIHICLIGKEVVLLVLIVLLILRVNDSADSITTVLNAAQWGKPGSEKEVERHDLIILSKTYATDPDAARTIWKRAYTPYKEMPVSFHICGLRPTGEVFIAGIVVLVASALSWLFQISFL